MSLQSLTPVLSPCSHIKLSCCRAFALLVLLLLLSDIQGLTLNITSEKLSPATPYKRSLHRNALYIALTTSQNGCFFWPAALSTRTVAPGRPFLSCSGCQLSTVKTPLHFPPLFSCTWETLPGSGSRLAPPEKVGLIWQQKFGLS